MLNAQGNTERDSERTRPSSLRDSPKTKSERTSKSRETEGSPASILATLDWLDFSNRASSIWVSFFERRRCWKFLASASFISIYAASSGVSCKNSAADPTFQPFASSRFLFDLLICILLVMNHAIEFGVYNSQLHASV